VFAEFCVTTCFVVKTSFMDLCGSFLQYAETPNAKAHWNEQ